MMSEPAYAAKSESIFVAMPDGVRLSVHVHRPDAPGRFPAILSYTPYRKGRLGAADPIVAHGYATVTFDIRGTGNSEGDNDSIYSAAERQDGCTMVEWAAAQDWCNGNVGMWGISFGAVVALQTAMAAPPALKAIIARSGTDDPYTEWVCPGGSPRPYMYSSYSPTMTAANFSPPDPAEVGDRWEAIWEHRLKHNVPWGIAFAEHLLDGPFWRDRSLRGHYDRIRCAVFVVDGWADWYCTPLLRTFAALRGPKRALIGPWSHQWPQEAVPGPQIDWPAEAEKWFDYWLKGIDNGVMREPPVTVFVRRYSPPQPLIIEDRGTFRCENAWPIERRIATPMYFGNGGQLAAKPPAAAEADAADTLVYDPLVGATTGFHGGGPFNQNWAMPLDQRADEALCLTYTTEPLADDVEVSGAATAVLHFEAGADITQFFVKLCDVAPDGTSALVTKGYLTTTHRQSHTRPTALEPGKPCSVEFDLLDCAYCFQRGHRIRIVVAGGDLMNVWPAPRKSTSRLFRTSARPSHVILPIIPRQNPPLPAPTLGPSGKPPIRLEDMSAPELTVTRDRIRQTATVQHEVYYNPDWVNRAKYVISAHNPAKTILDSQTQYACECRGKKIVSLAHCLTTSDETTFSHNVDLEIAVDGRPHFKKSWQASVPRGDAEGMYF